ncbi:hypothetical protein QR680_008132 [Steinernema hermaphroditum]|uniref:C-type lectin domain-containing protein n=1 Tax=Steinernema hermaphroditum TaxID=289476 RepID=A0AA39IFH0_9BILA|nr:hypothetical protein QR680_008132 [Steinernema hermaphroditum]
MKVHLATLGVLLLARFNRAKTRELRFTLISLDVVYNASVNKGVLTTMEACGMEAFSEKKVVVIVRKLAKGFQCVLPEKVLAFKEKEKTEEVYLVDTRQIDRCQVTPDLDVTELLSGKCDIKANLCQEVEKLSTHCSKTGNAKCIGEPAVEEKCPKGKKALNGAADCCFPITLNNGTEVCCPDNLFPGTDGSRELCCPHEENCCPPGTVVSKQTKGITAACCPVGTTYKGWINEKPVCCPAKMMWIKSVKDKVICCPGALDEYEKTLNKCFGYITIEFEQQASQSTFNQVCSDMKADTLKIDREYKNINLKDKLIALGIPEGRAWVKDGFRWLSDGSAPTYTNWDVGQPDGMPSGSGGAVFVVTNEFTGKWDDVNIVMVPAQTVCIKDYVKGQ